MIKRNCTLKVLVDSAEREGFEPSIPFRGIHTFQACSFNHSDTSPYRCASRRVTNKSIIISVCKLKSVFVRQEKSVYFARNGSDKAVFYFINIFISSECMHHLCGCSFRSQVTSA